MHMLPGSTADTSRLECAILAILCLSVVLMYWFAAKLWGPSARCVATGGDVNVLYDEYIGADKDVAFNNALIDTAKAFDHAVWSNGLRGQELRHMFYILQAQILILGGGVLLKTFL